LPRRSPIATAGPGTTDLHTHVAVANKVQTIDGRWLSIDGRVLFKANVAASETYNTALEQHLRDKLGVRFAERSGTDPGKRPIREIVGVDLRLNQRWSTRRADIEARRGELAIQFQDDHGRPPTPVEALHLAQQATLETRDAKHEPRTLAEQRTTWLKEAAAVLGGRAAVASMVQTALAPHAETTTIADSHWVAQTADHILTVMEESRATWQMWHVRAEAQRQIRTADLPRERASALVDLLVDEVLDDRSVALVAPADNIEEPEALRRVDGSSVYAVAGAALHTSTRILDAEARLVAAAGRRDGSAVDDPAVDLALLEMAANRTALIPGRQGWSDRCAAPGTSFSWRSLRRAPGRPPLCAPSPWPGPKTVATCSAWPHRRPQPLFSASKPASAPTHSPNSPGPCDTATCRTGRPRSARQLW
jgi:hypothetical protein